MALPGTNRLGVLVENTYADLERDETKSLGIPLTMVAFVQQRTVPACGFRIYSTVPPSYSAPIWNS